MMDWRHNHGRGAFLMATTFASLGLGELGPDEKLEVVGQLWDDLVASVPPGGLLTEAQRAELRRRVADATARPDDWVAWEEALAGTLRRA
jgi:putative addiction module component (TIGR02574 family)